MSVYVGRRLLDHSEHANHNTHFRQAMDSPGGHRRPGYFADAEALRVASAALELYIWSTRTWF
jgi:hypothetical protein